jgi:hypothetical protein
VNTDEKRAVLEAAGWVLYTPGVLQCFPAVLGYPTLYYIFVSAQGVGKPWPNVRQYGLARTADACINIAYRNFTEGIMVT